MSPKPPLPLLPVQAGRASGAPAGYSMADTSAFPPEATERHFQELRALLDGTLKA